MKSRDDLSEGEKKIETYLSSIPRERITSTGSTVDLIRSIRAWESMISPLLKIIYKHMCHVV